MSQLDMLRKKAKKWGGEVRDITTSYATGTVIISIFKDGQTYKFPYTSKTARNSLEVLAWSIRTLINCDERKILPFQKTAKEYLQLAGPEGEPFVEAEEKWFSVLGLTSQASNTEVIKSYKNHAKDFHPDTLAGIPEDGIRRDMEKKFSEMSEAYSEIKKARRF